MGDNLIGQQIPTAIIVAHVIEWLKTKAWFPFAKSNALWLNRITAGIAALASAGAVHYTFGTNGDFSLTGNYYTLLHALWAGVQQYALQHGYYKMAIRPPAAPVLVKAEPPHTPVTQEQPQEVPKSKDPEPPPDQPYWKTVKPSKPLGL